MSLPLLSFPGKKGKKVMKIKGKGRDACVMYDISKVYDQTVRINLRFIKYIIASIINEKDSNIAE